MSQSKVMFVWFAARRFAGETRMPLGIRPTNDFAFKKRFGAVENSVCLISLLNAILNPAAPIVDVAIDNPFNPQEFQGDKLSILDVKATDSTGALYNLEVQLAARPSLPLRLVYYAAELFTGQLRSGQRYAGRRPAYTICLIQGVLWRDTPRLHHAFSLTDEFSGRRIPGAIALHTLELGKFRLAERIWGRPVCFNAGCTGCCGRVTTRATSCCGCCRSRRYNKRRGCSAESRR